MKKITAAIATVAISLSLGMAPAAASTSPGTPLENTKPISISVPKPGTDFWLCHIFPCRTR